MIAPSVTAPITTASKPAESKPFSMVSGQNDRMAGSVPVYESFGDVLEKSAGSQGDGFGFSDIIDILNPLQHIPLVSNFYQSMTGDTIGAVAQIIGGGVFGGPIGAAVSAGMVALKNTEGQDDNATSINPVALLPSLPEDGRYNT